MDEVEDIKKQLTTKKTAKPIKAKQLLSTGCTQLNLACSGRFTGGIPKGKYVLLVGDSDSGKTWICLSLFAEAAINPEFDDYQFVYDPTEDGSMMDLVKFFGQNVESRIRPLIGTKEDPGSSMTVEEFYDAADDLVEEGKPFILILDSENALSSIADLEKIEENKKAHRKGKEGAGSYGTAKAKIHSDRLRILRNKLKKNGSILVIVSQTRDRIGFGAQFDPKTRSGGKALKFFADLEIWTAVKKNLTKELKSGKKKQLGILAEIKIKKNRITGKKLTVEMPIYHSHGIDDTGSCVDFLIEEKHWTAGKTISVPEFGVTLTKEALIQHIEQNDLISELRSIVAKVWQDIENDCQVNRKPRYM